MAEQTSVLPRLTSQKEFDEFRARAIQKWEAIWSGEKTVVSVGVGSSSIPVGALDVLTAFEAIADQENLLVRKTGQDGADWTDVQVRIKRKDAPAVVYRNVVASDAKGILDGKHRSKIIGVEGDEEYDGHKPLTSHPFYKYQQRIVLQDVGVIDPDSIEEAIARGAYMGLYKALFEMTAEEVIAEVTTANVRGRGGAGFPAGIKWESGRKARVTPKFVTCNSHEGEPNVYKDRRIHEGDPHRILEGILIACVAVGAERGYNYVGGEYPLAIQRFRKAVNDATALGLIGRNMLGSGKSVAFRLRTGGGAYVCGEGSAMMYSIMGVRGQPRTKPPRSVEEGLWKRPTVANNTETLSNMRDVVVKGGDWYRTVRNRGQQGHQAHDGPGPDEDHGPGRNADGHQLQDIDRRSLGRNARGVYIQGCPDRWCFSRSSQVRSARRSSRFRFTDRAWWHARLGRVRRFRRDRLFRRFRTVSDSFQSGRIVLEMCPMCAGEPSAGGDDRPHSVWTWIASGSAADAIEPRSTSSSSRFVASGRWRRCRCWG